MRFSTNRNIGKRLPFFHNVRNYVTRNQREKYPKLIPVATRWMDNDLFGHVNNAHYYSYFDSAVNRFLISKGHNIVDGDIGAFVVHSNCNYYQPITYPQNLDIGLSVKKLGNSSVTYSLGVFVKDEGVQLEPPQEDPTVEQALEIASGEFVHVFVDRKTNKPVAIPPHIKEGLEQIFVK